jgi:hypothetical protein
MFRLHVITALMLISPLSAARLSAAGAQADSPEAAVKQWFAALKKNDRRAYDSVVVSSGLANNLFDFAVAAESFKAKMIKAYGEVGWRNFQDAEGARITLAYHDMNVEQLKFDVEGDTAKGSLADGEKLLHMIRKKGRWQVDLETSFDSELKKGGMTAKSFGEAMGKMVKIIRDNESKIGGDITVDQLDKEMGAAFFAALAAAGAEPTISLRQN